MRDVAILTISLDSISTEQKCRFQVLQSPEQMSCSMNVFCRCNHFQNRASKSERVPESASPGQSSN
jgi:hypothetical protein